MSENTVLTKKNKYFSNRLFALTVSGLLLRLFLLAIIFLLDNSFSDPYFISDDIYYEDTVRTYMNKATGVFDLRLLDEIEKIFLEPLWPWVICVAGKMFGSIYAGRFINIIISSLCIPVIYKITAEITDEEKTALRAARMFAFLPVTVFTCCFPIKDILLTLVVMYTFYVFLHIQSGKKATLLRIISMAVSLWMINNIRGAVAEMLLLFFGVYILQRFAQQKNYMAVIASGVIILVVLVLSWDSIIGSFETKINDYEGYNDINSGVSAIKVASVSDIIKLPFSYFFATLQPVKLNFITRGNESDWLNIITILNISIYPVAIGNFLYIFQKKKNLFFWLSTLIMYCAVITLSLGIFRHYLFLIPIQMINYSLYLEKNYKNNVSISILGSVALFVGVLFLSLL